MIGSADLPTVLSWLVMYIVKFSLLLYAMITSAKFFFGDKYLVSIACGIIVYCIICFGIGNLKTNYNLATSWIRYVAFFIEFLVTIVAYIAMRICQDKKQKQQNTQNTNSGISNELQGEI